jgi:hypothetical protein
MHAFADQEAWACFFRARVGGARHFPLFRIECTLDEQEVVRERSKQSGKGLQMGRS